MSTSNEFQAKASEDNGATGTAVWVPSDSMTGEASRVDAGRTASATSEIMDVTAGETAPHSFPAVPFPAGDSAGEAIPSQAASPVAPDHLRALVERIERVEEEIKALNQDKSEIYKEAKSHGFDVKVMRKVVSARRMDKAEREEIDTLFDLYMAAVEGRLPHVHVHAREDV